MMVTILVFLLGLAVGSFVNCAAWRLEHKEKIDLFSRSFCDTCGRQLECWENIPVVSWLLLGGRCRTCHSPIPYQYPVVELGTGILFLSIWGPSTSLRMTSLRMNVLAGEVMFWWLMTVEMMIIFTSDWLYGMIPDVVVFPASMLALIFRLMTNSSILLTDYLISGLGALLFFYSIVWLTKGKGMGVGDVKLAFLMGVLLGWPKIFVALWLAFVIGAMAAGILLILKKKRLSDTMALGPFLVVGFYLALFFGERLWKLFLPI